MVSETPKTQAASLRETIFDGHLNTPDRRILMCIVTALKPATLLDLAGQEFCA